MRRCVDFYKNTDFRIDFSRKVAKIFRKEREVSFNLILINELRELSFG